MGDKGIQGRRIRQMRGERGEFIRIGRIRRWGRGGLEVMSGISLEVLTSGFIYNICRDLHWCVSIEHHDPIVNMDPFFRRLQTMV